MKGQKIDLEMCNRALDKLLEQKDELLAEVKRLRRVLELIAKEHPHDPWIQHLVKETEDEEE